MKPHSNNSKEQFERTVDFLMEDIDSLSPHEVRAALDDVGISSTDAQSMVKEAIQAYRRHIGALKLARAKQLLSESTGHTQQVTSLDSARARAALQSYWRRHPSEVPTTLAARKGEGLSDDTALKMYQSLVELGAISPDEGTGDV